MMREDGRRGKEGEEFQLSDSFVKLILQGYQKMKGLEGFAPLRYFCTFFNTWWCLKMEITGSLFLAMPPLYLIPRCMFLITMLLFYVVKVTEAWSRFRIYSKRHVLSKEYLHNHVHNLNYKDQSFDWWNLLYCVNINYKSFSNC